MSSPHQSVPPGKSSHTAETGSSTGSSSAATGRRTVIRVTQLAYLGVVVLTLGVFLFVVGWPKVLWWLMLLPVAVIVWIARTRTVVSDSGLELRKVFSSRHLDWEQVKGVSIPKRGYVRAHLADDSQVPLPAVGYDQLRKLIKASGGRLPDVFAAEEAKRQAEWEARQAEREAEAAKAESSAQAAGESSDTQSGSGAAGSASETSEGPDTGSGKD
ncbi:MAG TPA: PH domain-containing protein [Nocardia sp.]|uniref:PH domain-containing protein n=1 Tax=Nocardia TaxID=1817 RepID=UPI0024557311|nr:MULTISPECIES: PH domain-containing protein [Nocardia]HLS79334.1 PH domain-containing protein [Nocardia sp.]